MKAKIKTGEEMDERVHDYSFKPQTVMTDSLCTQLSVSMWM